jgi:hypothetical protein
MNAARVAAALIDAYNRHDLVAYAALHADTARVTFANTPGALDVSGWTQVLARLYTALPDLAVTPITICHGATSAVVELRQTGTNTGALILDDGARTALGCDLDHIPPTGRPIDTTGVVVLDVTAGRIVTERHHWPPAWLYQQLGLVTVTARPTNGARSVPHPH